MYSLLKVQSNKRRKFQRTTHAKIIVKAIKAITKHFHKLNMDREIDFFPSVSAI